MSTSSTDLLLIGLLRSWTSALVLCRKSDGALLSLAYRFWDFFPALQQSLERLQVGSHLAPDHPLEHRPDESEEAARLRLDARREARPLRRARLIGENHGDRHRVFLRAPMSIAPVRLVVDDLEGGLEPASQGLLRGREPPALPKRASFGASSWRTSLTVAAHWGKFSG